MRTLTAALVIAGTALLGACVDDGFRDFGGTKFRCNDNGNIAREVNGPIVLRGPDAEAVCR